MSNSITSRWIEVRRIEATLPDVDVLWLFPLDCYQGAHHLCEATRREAAIALVSHTHRLAADPEISAYLGRLAIGAAEQVAAAEARVTGFTVGGAACQK